MDAENVQKNNELMNNLILFDGVCNLCNGAVQKIIRWDSKRKFRFASIQSEIGQKMIAAYEENSDALHTIYLIQNDKIHQQSTAALKIIAGLKFPVNLLSVFLIIPSFIRDYIYDIISKNRYKWFGKQDYCMMPDPELAQLFIE